MNMNIHYTYPDSSKKRKSQITTSSLVTMLTVSVGIKIIHNKLTAKLALQKTNRKCICFLTSFI